MKAAVKLAGWNPVKNQTRKDLLVYGGWLTSRWEWSRDIDVSLDQAIVNSRRLGEDVRVVGNPSLADRKKVRGRKPLPVDKEPPRTKPSERPSAEIPRQELPRPPEAPPRTAEQQPPEPEPLQMTNEGLEEPTRVLPPAVAPPPQIPAQAVAEARTPLGSRLLLERFLVAAMLCSIALFLGYFELAGRYYVFTLLLADAFFVVATALLAVRRWILHSPKRPSVKAPSVPPAK
ncbi:MAG: hypothetical protein OK456_10875 [Thaumarchaeota archaeon]|nr:hypothetical protein [Nitrososphaerota archaeon]